MIKSAILRIFTIKVLLRPPKKAIFLRVDYRWQNKNKNKVYNSNKVWNCKNWGVNFLDNMRVTESRFSWSLSFPVNGYQIPGVRGEGTMTTWQYSTRRCTSTGFWWRWGTSNDALACGHGLTLILTITQLASVCLLTWHPGALTDSWAADLFSICDPRCQTFTAGWPLTPTGDVFASVHRILIDIGFPIRQKLWQ